MANYSILKAAIAQVIKTNGNNEITGNLLQQQLFSMVNTLGTGYQCMGVAVLTPTPTNPGTPDANVFYIASEPGTYANFGNIVINDGEVCLLTYNGTWSKLVTGAATASQLNQLGQRVTNSYFEGDGTNYSFSYIYGLTPGRKYRVILFDNAWETPTIGTTQEKFSIYAYPDGVSTQLVSVRGELGVSSYYDIVIPSNNQMLMIGGRAVSGLKVRYIIIDITELNYIEQKSLIAGDELGKTITNGYYVTATGAFASWAAAKLYIYQVTPNTTINVFSGKGRSGSVVKYALYSGTPSDSTVVLVSDKSTDNAYNETILVPNNASYIVVSVIDDAPTGVSIAKGLADSEIIPIDKIAQSAFDQVLTRDSAKLIRSGLLYSILGGEIKKGKREVVSGKYIGEYGAISSYSSYKLDVYDVTPGEQVHISRTPSSGGASRIYAIYNTADDTQWGSATCLGYSTEVITSTNEQEIFLTIPAGSAVLVVCTYPGSNYYPGVFLKKQFSGQNYFDLLNNLSVDKSFCAEVDNNGESLYIAYLDGMTEYTFWFKKCMANQLYTFYRVGYRTVSRDYADTDGIKNETGITYLNSTGSDNIGPLGFNDGGMVGGNHVWNNDSSLNCKTAKTDSYTIYFDDKLALPGDKKYCKSVKVLVVNTLYDPSETPVSGQTILTTPASTERTMYEIQKNNIFVSVSQKLADNCENILSRYYGMQSMFNSEQYYMTPRGQFSDWTSVADASFHKNNYPDFNRFIEKSANGYQGAYLIPNKAGNHSMLGNSSAIFSYSTGKCYHSIFRNGDITVATPGLQFAWSGVYTFFKTALVDDSDIFAYFGIVNGKIAVFINTKRACTKNITMPSEYWAKKMVEVEKTSTITTGNEFIDVDGVSIVATGAGSFIFTIE